LPRSTADDGSENFCAVFEYNEQTSPFVYSLKDSGNGYAICAAASLLAEQVAHLEFDLITCIPSDKARMRERGYNPPALIAREISAILRIPHNVRLLSKARRTDIQKSLTRSERLDNIKGVFSANTTVTGRILLIDDVRTTGATLSEATQVLYSAGASRVFAAAVAQVPDYTVTTGE